MLWPGITPNTRTMEGFQRHVDQRAMQQQQQPTRRQP